MSAEDGETATLTSPHFALSNYFGSGFYASSTGELAVINMPFEYQPKHQKSQHKYRIRMPVSVGFYDYNFEEIDDVKLPSSVSALSLTLGLEFDRWLTPNLKLVPFFDVGYSRNSRIDESAFLYALGASTYYSFSGWQQQHSWMTRVQRAGYKTDREGVSDGFASIETGVDLIMPGRFTLAEQTFFVSLYSIAYVYLLDVDFIPEKFAGGDEAHAIELGFTIGREKPFNFFGLDVERLGLGIRHSNDLDVLRFAFNYPLD
ncbi:hypothetical protein SIN8267_01892 [Sinobacterium norvegicum]|uniref:Bacterial surface antigen (D15) domain-containing protein n=1 Tax=Sinobacterium norvegicum TaxID=1641715 RepID=A0ABN8EJD7_9GAMM|nr:hypothetical protein SIN8267_01892 [Sinobacterium norvegicum]